ncbi:hypothetical protein I7I48_02709 [Histoplasma ohiense]|nr:hypothetical protein I7I48_02709 [Histoplasma ohiense (nom. inval.)]
MSTALLQALVRNGDEVIKDAWYLDESKIAFPHLLDVVSRLQRQLEVQTVVLSTTNLLRQNPVNKPLPNQQATRVKHFVRFVFEAATRGKDRQTRLRNLDCTSLKFCGLSYTVREILELPSQVFDFLLENIADFVEHQQLSLLLCRDDINKAVLSDVDPDDDELFKSFIACCFPSFPIALDLKLI